MSLRRAGGFSLIELMIVLVVIGVLSAIAWPSYQDYVRRGHRSAAQAFMLMIAGRQEQYLLTNRSYATTVGALNLTQPTETIGRYAFDFPTLTNTTYVIRATPEGNQAVTGKFGILTLSSDGTKASSENPEEWKR